jgi:hypothetical protein
MIGKAKFLENHKEVDQAKELNLGEVDEKYIFDIFGFDINSVESFHTSDDGEIRLWMKSGKSWTLEYDKAIWDKLKKLFANV